VSGQLHALAALPPGKEPQYPLDRRLGKYSVSILLIFMLLSSAYVISFTAIKYYSKFKLLKILDTLKHKLHRNDYSFILRISYIADEINCLQA
jgi:hypothetical protein